MTITVSITMTEEEYQEAKKDFEEVNDVKYTREMYIDDQLEYFYADCREYIIDKALVKAEVIQKGNKKYGQIQRTKKFRRACILDESHGR